MGYGPRVGVFTQLQDDELVELASTFGLGTVERYEPISAGTINSNYAVTTDRGRWFVRVNEGKAELDVAWEAQLVEALAARGVVTPSRFTRAMVGRTRRCPSRGSARPGEPAAPRRLRSPESAGEPVPLACCTGGLELLVLAARQHLRPRCPAGCTRIVNSGDPALARAEVLGESSRSLVAPRWRGARRPGSSTAIRFATTCWEAGRPSRSRFRAGPREPAYDLRCAPDYRCRIGGRGSIWPPR
jgi:hypothetical protein